MEGLLRFNEWLSGVVWGWPMLLLLALAGAFFTARTRFVQLRRFGDMLRLTHGRVHPTAKTQLPAKYRLCRR